MPELIDQADISGDPLPEPVRTSQEVASQARQTANQNRAQPTPSPSPQVAPPQPKGQQAEKSGGNPVGDAFSALGDSFSPLKGLPGAVEHGLQQAQGTGPLKTWEKNPFLPVSVGAHMFDSAWGQAAFTAQAAKQFGLFLNPDMISESAKNVWERQDAAGQVMKGLWESGKAMAGPGAQLLSGALQQRGISQEQQMGTLTGQGLSLTGNPANVVMPEGRGAQLVAMIGLPLAQSLWSSGDGMAFFKQLANMDLHDPQTYMNLLWGASTALMLRGHIPAAQSAVLRKLHPEWADLERQFLATRDAHNSAQRAAVSRDQAPLEDWRDKLMRNQPVPGGPKVLVNGISYAQQDRSATLVGRRLPSGEIRMEPSTEAQAHIDRQKAVLRKLGYKSVEDLGLGASMKGITGKAAQTIVDHWKDLGQTYDLIHESEPDRPLHSPIDSLNRYGKDSGLLAKAVHFDNLERAYGAVMRQTNFFTNDVPRSMFRSMLGLARTKDVVHEMYWGAVHDLIDGHNLDGKQITKAMEGDTAVYDALPPVGKHVVDSARRLNALYQTLAKNSGYRNDFLGNFFWRRPQRSESLTRFLSRGKGGKPPVASEKFSHRATKIVTDPATGELRSVPAYSTVQETNQAIQEQRDYYAGRLSDPAVSADGIEALLNEMQDVGVDEAHPWDTLEGKKQTPLPNNMQRDPEVQAIRQLANSDPEAARKLATQWVNARFPLMEQDFFKVAPAAMRRQIGALHTHQSVDMLSKTLSTFQDPTGRPRLQPSAVRLTPGDSRQAQELANAGYKPVDIGRRYDGWVFHPDFADSLTQALSKGSSLRSKASYKAMLAIERKAIKAIMFIPMAHGLNVAGRFGTYWLQHPLDTTRWLLAGHDRPFSLPLGKAGSALHDLSDPNHERDALAYRMEAWSSGMVTPDKASNFGYEFSKTHAGAIGDGDFIDSAATQDLSETPANARRSGLSTVGGKASNLYNGSQQKFWSWVNDFGTMVYHLDKERLMRNGFPEEDARLYAMRRANTWMGHVAPEDWNPVMHDILRGVMFAPNWWRTMLEMYVPRYGKMGITWTPQMIRHVVGQEMKTAAASLAFQKITGNALNMLTSGHLQNQNQPGAQDKIEMTEPWTDHLPWTHGVPRTDPKTGAVRTLENPLTRQTLDLERVLGYESGRPGGPSKQAGPLQISAPSDWSAVMGGTALTGIGRLSPALEAGLDVLGGVDVYGSIRDGTLRHLDPGMQGQRFGPTAMSTLMGMLQMLPGGQEAAYQIAQGNKEFAQGKSWGTVTSDTIQRMLGTEPQQVLSGWFTGVNPAYSYANKSAGTPPGDAQFAAAAKLKDDQQRWLSDSSTAVLSGGTLQNGQPATLQNWLREYHDREIAYVNQMSAYYGNDPTYLNGQDGLVNQWEQLYDKARFDPSDPLSEINYAKLDQLQAQFKGDHSSAQWQLLQQGLAQHQQQNPMVRLYHDTLTAYGDVQQLWAQQRGVSSAQLRSEISEYGQLHSQTKEADAYLRQHPDLQAWEGWKKNVFYKSPLGMLYGLWYGSSSVLGKVQDLPAFQQQVIQTEEQQLFPQEQALEAAASNG